MAAGLILFALEENRLQRVPTVCYKWCDGPDWAAPKVGRDERGRDVGLVEWGDS